MSASLYLYSEHGPLNIEPADDEPCVWIRTRHETVALTLDSDDRAALRGALDTLDAREQVPA